MALTASTIRPVQRFGETEVCLGISIFRELKSSSTAAQQRNQKEDEEQEEQDLGYERRSRRQHREAEHSADERDD